MHYVARIFAIALLSPIGLAQAEPPVEVCKEYAANYAHEQTSGAVLKGGAAGAFIGATIGAFAGGAGTGAAIGGGVGAIGGHRRKISAYKHVYVDAFADCMAGRVGLF